MIESLLEAMGSHELEDMGIIGFAIFMTVIGCISFLYGIFMV